ncbi:MAG: copper chaperone [Cytophagaceae bacterium]
MKVLKFKTDIDSKRALAGLMPLLDREEMISKWKLDVDSPEHILNVSGDEITPEMVIKIVRESGYEAELLQVIAVGGHDL